MASLQQITTDGRDCWRLRFYVDKRRETVGLGAFGEPEAVIAKDHVEHLVEQTKTGRPISVKTSRWLDSLPAEIHDRLSAIGLCEARVRSDMPRTVVAFMRAYIASRTDWKKTCNHKQSVDHLAKFLGRDVPLSVLTKGDAERFHRWMMAADAGSPDLSPNTSGQHIKRCRQMMRAAMQDKLVDNNPFLDVKIDLRSDKSKNRFVDAETATLILDACPDQEWRTLFALCRFGGLRCPSEVLGVRWSDIQWDRNRFTVRSPKTEKYGKAQRVVPLFPELLDELNSLFGIVAPGVKSPADGFVITRYRDSETNLRTTLGRITEQAGITPWPKPFMALRASRRTELERSGRHPNHVLNEWFGHTGAIAETHYLQVTEDDFDDAVVPFVVPSQGKEEPREAIKKQKNPGKTGALMAASGGQMDRKYTRQDSNLQPSVPKCYIVLQMGCEWPSNTGKSSFQV
ncbi:MAG TPA: site-specific recombinase [Planctomycetaceae bacterium]|nr:site-specific recombinase [Planctomycetaceae bacterium]